VLEAVRSLFPPVDGTVMRDQGVEAGRIAERIGGAALTGMLEVALRDGAPSPQARSG